MLAKRIVACLDVRQGRVVKGVRFGNLREAGDPVECAARYCDEGIDELVVLDVSATLEDRLACLETVDRVARQVNVPLTVGGGIRTEEDAIRLLDAGADKVALNSAAVDDPSKLQRLALRYGTQCVVLSIDVAEVGGGLYEVVSRSGTLPNRRDALDWAKEAQALGAGEILLTSIDRDGTQQGFDLSLVSKFAKALRVPIVASGGATGPQSFADALEAGADAVLAASVFHDSVVTIADVKNHCRERGLEVRPC